VLGTPGDVQLDESVSRAFQVSDTLAGIICRTGNVLPLSGACLSRRVLRVELY